MKFTDLTAASLRRLSTLIHKKEALQVSLAEIDAKIEAIGGRRKANRLRKKRRPLSAAARKAIAAGQRRRRAREKRAGNGV